VKILTSKQVIIRIAIIIASAEFLIMAALTAFPHEAGTFSAVVLDTALLALVSTPAIYIWVIRPFVKARDEALAQVRESANVDPLTQLANRRLLSKHLERAIAGIVRHKIYGALLLLDLDGFKPVNDAHGHNAGDAVLVEVAKRMQSITRSEDIVARLGGDEFLVLISNLDSDERTARDKASLIATKLINLVNEPYDFHGVTLRVGVSIGIRLLGSEGLATEKAISEADMAMYRAKQAGGGCAVFFEPGEDKH
jgi:diguanylate cyclase (GGDEF)-like protein